MTTSIYKATFSDVLDVVITETRSGNNVSTHFQLTFKLMLDVKSFLVGINAKHPLIQKLFALLNINEGSFATDSESDHCRFLFTSKNIKWELSFVNGVNKVNFEDVFMLHRQTILHYKNPRWLRYYQQQTELLPAEANDLKARALYFLRHKTSEFTIFRTMMNSLIDHLTTYYPEELVMDLVESDPEVRELLMQVGADIKLFAGEILQLPPSFLHKTTDTQVSCNLRKENALLDLGAGLGSDSIFFAEQGFTVTAVDHSKRAKHHFDSLCPREIKANIDYQLMDLNDEANAVYLEDLIRSNLYIIAVRALKYLDPKSLERLLTAIIDHALVGTQFIVIDELINPYKNNLAKIPNGIASLFASRIDWQRTPMNELKNTDGHYINVFKRIA